MNYLGFDTETHLIAADQPAPRLVCSSFAWEGENGERADALCLRDNTVENFRYWAEQTDYTFVLHNAAFDMTVMVVNYPELLPLILDLYKSRRIVDTQLNERLHYLARNSYQFETLKFSMAHCYERHMGVDISGTKTGDDIWRLRYNELDGVPLAEWPADPITYAKDDAWHTLEIWNAQQYKFGDHLEDLFYQVEADFFLRIMTVVGFQTDPEAHAALTQRVRDNINAAMPTLLGKGLYVANKKKMEEGHDFPYTKKKAIFEKLIIEAAAKADMEPPRNEPTEKMLAEGKEEGSISCGKEAVSLLMPYCDILKTYNAISADLTNQTKYLKPLDVVRMHAQFNVLVATGRTSSYKPNAQNFPREEGYRECLVADPGHLLLAIDYDFIELVSLAYATKELLGLPVEELGLYQTINQGKDPHLVTALEILKADGVTDYQTYEDILAAHEAEVELVDKTRQMAKAPNFGYPGGMGAPTFIEFARGYGMFLTLEEAEKLKAAWMSAFPEMAKYFEYVGDMESDADGFTVHQLSTDRVRAGAPFCAACNSFFQGLTADGAKRGIIETGRMCYGDEAFAGCSQKLFIHDEIIFQIPDYEDADKRQEVVDAFEGAMVSGMQAVMPGMKVGVGSTLTRIWMKKAKSRYDSMGRLDVYEG